MLAYVVNVCLWLEQYQKWLMLARCFKHRYWLLVNYACNTYAFPSEASLTSILANVIIPELLSSGTLAHTVAQRWRRRCWLTTLVSCWCRCWLTTPPQSLTLTHARLIPKTMAIDAHVFSSPSPAVASIDAESIDK